MHITLKLFFFVVLCAGGAALQDIWAAHAPLSAVATQSLFLSAVTPVYFDGTDFWGLFHITKESAEHFRLSPFLVEQKTSSTFSPYTNSLSLVLKALQKQKGLNYTRTAQDVHIRIDIPEVAGGWWIFPVSSKASLKRLAQITGLPQEDFRWHKLPLLMTIEDEVDLKHRVFKHRLFNIDQQFESPFNNSWENTIKPTLFPEEASLQKKLQTLATLLTNLDKALSK